MTAKTFLERAGRLDLKIDVKLEQVEHLRSLAYKVTSVIRENPGSSGGTPKSALEDAVIKLVMAENMLNADIDRFVDMKRELAEMLEGIPDEEERLLLNLRYLCLNRWEDIARKMNLSLRSVYRLHRIAVDSFGRVFATKEPGDAVSFGS
ncbi:MAG: DUF1492 domain-containing protein [Candidatus Pelethousia sp.]|nr:DUF1492 domain-containing protein [Candidatus Pelethousia sp.]